MLWLWGYLCWGFWFVIENIVVGLFVLHLCSSLSSCRLIESLNIVAADKRSSFICIGKLVIFQKRGREE